MPPVVQFAVNLRNETTSSGSLLWIVSDQAVRLLRTTVIVSVLAR